MILGAASKVKGTSAFWLALWVWCLGGCAMAGGPPYVYQSADEGRGKLYIYRLPSLSASVTVLTPVVTLDGEDVGLIKNGGYFVLDVDPGGHALAIKSAIFGNSFGDDRKFVHFNIKPGCEVFVEYMQRTVGYEIYGDTEVAEIEEVFAVIPRVLAETRITKTKLMQMRAR